ncbi:MAG TPA: hypothetical protein VKM93_22330 [Terriglobia bacterium]|nr:hypothetical protein [Terriglobia bacterium]
MPIASCRLTIARNPDADIRSSKLDPAGEVRISSFVRWPIGNRQSAISNSPVLAALVVMATVASPAWSIHPCAECHPKEVAGFAATQMGRSLGRPTQQPPGSFVHQASNSRFSIESTDSRMVQRVERGGVKGEYEIAYQVGSGTHAFAYLIQIGGHLFQSPLGYFAGRGWDMSPGYETQKAPDFYRPVTQDCLFCHSGRTRPVPGTYNTFESPPFEAEAITCQRCHGPLEAHLHNPVPGSIVNPANLPTRARNSVCEQCHLVGDERVPNPGKQLADFQPGENLEDVYSVYVSAASRDLAGSTSLRVVSQVQQLALSRCARESGGKMWCGSCHDPHEQPADPKTYFRARCLACHGAALVKTHPVRSAQDRPVRSAQGRPKPNDDCIGCHMPRRPVTDGAHTVFTDHHISRRPGSAADGELPIADRRLPIEREDASRSGLPIVNRSRRAGSIVNSSTPALHPEESLVAWHDPPPALAERNLGLAETRVGDRLESPALVNQGFQLLLDCWPNFPHDAAVLTEIGRALLAAGHGAEAVPVFEQAIQIEPDVAVHYLHVGLAWEAAHDSKKAIENLEKALQLDPLLEQPYRELAGIYSEAGDAAITRQTYERYLKAFPQNLAAQKQVTGYR